MKMAPILLFMATSCGVTPSNVPPPAVHPFAAQGAIVYPTAEQFLAVDNQMRAEKDLQPMEHDDRLQAAADKYIKVCRDKGAINHFYGGTVGDRIKREGFDYWLAEEILCGGPQMLGRDPFSLWKDSPAHYASIMGQCTHCAYAVAYDKNGYGYWIGVFGKPK